MSRNGDACSWNTCGDLRWRVAGETCLERPPSDLSRWLAGGDRWEERQRIVLKDAEDYDRLEGRQFAVGMAAPATHARAGR